MEVGHCSYLAVSWETYSPSTIQ